VLLTCQDAALFNPPVSGLVTCHDDDASAQRPDDVAMLLTCHVAVLFNPPLCCSVAAAVVTPAVLLIVC
jgi:hypothetical protein